MPTSRSVTTLSQNRYPAIDGAVQIINDRERRKQDREARVARPPVFGSTIYLPPDTDNLSAAATPSLDTFNVVRKHHEGACHREAFSRWSDTSARPGESLPDSAIFLKRAQSLPTPRSGVSALELAPRSSDSSRVL